MLSQTLDLISFLTRCCIFFLSFPSVLQIAYKAETIDWTYYPSVQYVFGWEVNKNDTEQLSKFFHIIWEEDSFGIWKKISKRT